LTSRLIAIAFGDLSQLLVCFRTHSRT